MNILKYAQQYYIKEKKPTIPGQDVDEDHFILTSIVIPHELIEK
jgi:hypothetical protein